MRNYKTIPWLYEQDSWHREECSKGSSFITKTCENFNTGYYNFFDIYDYDVNLIFKLNE